MHCSRLSWAFSYGNVPPPSAWPLGLLVCLAPPAHDTVNLGFVAQVAACRCRARSNLHRPVRATLLCPLPELGHRHSILLALLPVMGPCCSAATGKGCVLQPSRPTQLAVVHCFMSLLVSAVILYRPEWYAHVQPRGCNRLVAL